MPYNELFDNVKLRPERNQLPQLGLEMPPKKNPDAGAPDKNPPKERPTAPVQLNRELVEMLNVIAAHRGTSANALLTPLVRQWVVTNYEIVAREMQQRAAAIRAEQ